jgi:hypothetical protein
MSADPPVDLTCRQSGCMRLRSGFASAVLQHAGEGAPPQQWRDGSL